MKSQTIEHPKAKPIRTILTIFEGRCKDGASVTARTQGGESGTHPTELRAFVLARLPKLRDCDPLTGKPLPRKSGPVARQVREFVESWEREHGANWTEAPEKLRRLIEFASGRRGSRLVKLGGSKP